MKQFIFLIAVFYYLPVSSQDLIIRKNGDELKVKVIEIAGSSIKYKKWENLNGPLYNIEKVEVFKVKYENGESDFFGNVTEAKPATSTIIATSKTGQTHTDKQPAKPIVTVVAPSYPSPPSANIPYQYDERQGTLLSLETVNVNSEWKHSGLWGKHNIVTLPGAFSRVQLRKSQNPKFIIRFDSDVEPLTTCLMHVCEVNDKLKQREFVAETKGMHGKEEVHDDVLITFEKIAPLTYLVTLDKKLKPGEMFFTVESSNQAYAFGYSK